MPKVPPEGRASSWRWDQPALPAPAAAPGSGTRMLPRQDVTPRADREGMQRAGASRARGFLPAHIPRGAVGQRRWEALRKGSAGGRLALGSPRSHVGQHRRREMLGLQGAWLPRRSTYDCGPSPKSQQTPCQKSEALGSGTTMTFFL